MKAKGDSSVAVASATTKFLLGMCDCSIDSDVSTDDFLLVLGNLHICGHAHVRSQVSLGLL